MEELRKIVAENTQECNSSMEKVLSVKNLSMLQLRDVLMCVGKILLEDLDNDIYMAQIIYGKRDFESAIVGFKLKGDKLYAYFLAHEGKIFKNKINKSYSKVLLALEEENKLDIDSGNIKIKKQKKSFRKVLFLFICLVCVIIIGLTKLIPKGDEVYVKYNKAIKDYNEVAGKYNEMVKHTDVDNITNFPKHIKIMKEKRYQCFDKMELGFSQDKIQEVTSDVIKEMEENVYRLMIMQQITNPSENWVIQRLKKIKGISEIGSTTQAHDPNMLLDEKGGYTSCVYFSLDSVNQNNVDGKDIIDKGTDAGGAIEVYKTKEAANVRIQYLSDFDDTVLCSGSHIVLGTMVIRTSYDLSDEEQYNVTNDIVNMFLKLE